MEPNGKQKALLKNLHELLIYGNSKFTSIGLKKSISLKKRMLFYMTGATQSYAEAVFKIMSPPNYYDKSALILLRSITENLINVGYIHACDNQVNAALYFIDGFQDDLKFANRYKCLMMKYPKRKYHDWNLIFGSKKRAKDWNGYISKTKRRIASWQKRYQLVPNSELPSIEERCVQHDKYLKAKGKLNSGNSLEKLYVTYYRYFSQIAHLSVRGLGAFLNYSSKTKQIDPRIDSAPSEIETIIPLTYAAYYAILKYCLDRFDVLNKKEVKKFDELSKTMAF